MGVEFIYINIIFKYYIYIYGGLFAPKVKIVND